MYFEESKETLKSVSQDERLNSDDWIRFEPDIIFLVEPAIKLLDTFQYFLGVSSRTAEYLIDYAERYNLYSDVKEARMKAIENFNSLKLEFPEKADYFETQKKETLDKLNIPEDKFFLSAMAKVAYDRFLKTVHRIHLSQLAGEINILGEWKDTETYMRPLDFMQWVISNGYEMPEIVEILHEEESKLIIEDNTKQQIESKLVKFAKIKEALDDYLMTYSKRNNDALVSNILKYLYRVDGKIAKQLLIEYQEDKNPSRTKKDVIEKFYPKLKKLYPDLPDLPI